jgi:protein kinase
MKQRFVTWEECLQLREIISLRRLQHPNVIKLKEVVRENTELCMVFEFMEQNIYQILKERSASRGHGPNLFDEKEIRSIATQTLLGLQAIHKGGFMHRDLKPENLLTKGDLVKIADFGLAKEIRSRPPFTEYVSTRWYRAPEIVLRSDRYNSPIDIWALGTILVELYLNRPLFPGASDTDQLFKICSVLGAPSQNEWEDGHQMARRLNLRFPQVSPTPLRQLMANTNASPAALDLLEAMLRFNPADRPTASQCLSHPFITGGDGSAYGTANLFMGISSGQSHNPFHAAVGVPGVPSNSGPGGNTSHHAPHPGGGSSGSTTTGTTFQRNSPSPGGSPTPGTGGGSFPNNAGSRMFGQGTGFPGHGGQQHPPQAPGSPYTQGQQYGAGGAGGGGGGGFRGYTPGNSQHQYQQQQQQQGFPQHQHQHQQQPPQNNYHSTGGSYGSNGGGSGYAGQSNHARSHSGGGGFGNAGPLDEY